MIKLGQKAINDTSLRFKLHTPERSWIARLFSGETNEDAPSREVVDALLDRRRSSRPRKLGRVETESRYEIGFVRNYFICGAVN